MEPIGRCGRIYHGRRVAIVEPALIDGCLWCAVVSRTCGGFPSDRRLISGAGPQGRSRLAGCSRANRGCWPALGAGARSTLPLRVLTTGARAAERVEWISSIAAYGLTQITAIAGAGASVGSRLPGASLEALPEYLPNTWFNGDSWTCLVATNEPDTAIARPCASLAGQKCGVTCNAYAWEASLIETSRALGGVKGISRQESKPTSIRGLGVIQPVAAGPPKFGWRVMHA